MMQAGRGDNPADYGEGYIAGSAASPSRNLEQEKKEEAMPVGQYRVRVESLGAAPRSPKRY